MVCRLSEGLLFCSPNRFSSSKTSKDGGLGIVWGLPAASVMEVSPSAPAGNMEYKAVVVVSLLHSSVCVATVLQFRSPVLRGTGDSCTPLRVVPSILTNPRKSLLESRKCGNILHERVLPIMSKIRTGKGKKSMQTTTHSNSMVQKYT